MGGFEPWGIDRADMNVTAAMRGGQVVRMAPGQDGAAGRRAGA